MFAILLLIKSVFIYLVLRYFEDCPDPRVLVQDNNWSCAKSLEFQVTISTIDHRAWHKFFPLYNPVADVYVAMWGRPRPLDTDTIHHNFAGCFWRVGEFLMKPSNLHERRQLFGTASEWYLPFTLCHLKDRPRGEWRFVPATAVCPAGLIKCST